MEQPLGQHISPEEHIAYALTVFGKVQGVNFRAHARHTALQLGLIGFVRNQTDGSVHAWVQGPYAQVRSFLEWAKTGPAESNVTDTHITFHQPEPHHTEFVVLPDADPV